MKVSVFVIVALLRGAKMPPIPNSKPEAPATENVINQLRNELLEGPNKYSFLMLPCLTFRNCRFCTIMLVLRY